MTFASFKSMAAAYMGRSTTEFSMNGVDLLSRAVNRARRWAEREADFEFARAQVDIDSVNLTTGQDINTAVLRGTATAVKPKKLERCFIRTTSGGFIPVKLTTAGQYSRDKLYPLDQIANLEMVQQSYPVPIQLSALYLKAGYVAHRRGTQLYLLAVNEQTSVTTLNTTCDIVRWMADYSADGDTDFFLDEGEAWMLYRTIIELNIFMKEDSRVAISSTIVKEAWENLLKWNNTLTQGEIDTSLD